MARKQAATGIKLTGDEAIMEFLKNDLIYEKAEVARYENLVKMYSKYPTIKKQAEMNLANAKKGVEKTLKDIENLKIEMQRRRR